MKKQIGKSIHSFELDVSVLNPGVYFIEINTATGSVL
jgi:hypothetical protein